MLSYFLLRNFEFQATFKKHFTILNGIIYFMYTFQIDYIVACYLRPVDGRPTEYFNEISSIVQKCPIGTVFNTEYCVCDQDTSFSRQG